LGASTGSGDQNHLILEGSFSLVLFRVLLNEGDEIGMSKMGDIVKMFLRVSKKITRARRVHYYMAIRWVFAS
jgi:hypothetical protein